MKTSAELTEFQRLLLNVVRIKVRRLTGRYGYGSGDREDIVHDLLRDCLPRLQKFDPAKSSLITFIHRIVNNSIAILIEGRMAACRDYRMCQQSLNDPIGLSKSLQLGDTIAADDNPIPIGRPVRPAAERVELELDVDRVISALPRNLAILAVLLKSLSISESCEQLRLSRSTVNRRVGDLRAAFEHAGLGQYLGRSKRSFKELRRGSPLAVSGADVRR